VPTPKFGLVYKLSHNADAYLRLARGARAPQTSDLYRLQINQEVPEARVEKLDSAEIGLRGALAGGSYSLAGFFMVKRNFFFRDADGFNVPDGRTRHLGVEGEVDIPLTGTLRVNGAASYARHSYRFERIVGRDTETIRSGNDVDTAPRWQGNLRLLWAFLPDAEAELEWEHVGRYYTDAANLNEYDGHDVLNLRLAWRPAERIELHAALRNLTDAKYAKRADFAFGTERFFPGEPVAFSFGAAYRF